jgi:hypothetical protein
MDRKKNKKVRNVWQKKVAAEMVKIQKRWKNEYGINIDSAYQLEKTFGMNRRTWSKLVSGEADDTVTFKSVMEMYFRISLAAKVLLSPQHGNKEQLLLIRTIHYSFCDIITFPPYLCDRIKEMLCLFFMLKRMAFKKCVFLPCYQYYVFIRRRVFLLSSKETSQRKEPPSRVPHMGDTNHSPSLVHTLR